MLRADIIMSTISALNYVMGFSLLSALIRVSQKINEVRTKQITARYAGARRLLYKNHLSIIMRLFKPIYNERKGDFNGQ